MPVIVHKTNDSSVARARYSSLAGDNERLLGIQDTSVLVITLMDHTIYDDIVS